MIDFILFGILGICVFIGATILITSAEWCQKLMLKKYFPQTVEILKHYRVKYDLWEGSQQSLEKLEKQIKEEFERIPLYIIGDEQDKILNINKLYRLQEELEEVEKDMKEELTKDKILIEAHAPFILFSAFHDFKILDRQEFCFFDVIWTHRKQKKVKKIFNKHFSYLEKSGK